MSSQLTIETVLKPKAEPKPNSVLVLNKYYYFFIC